MYKKWKRLSRMLFCSQWYKIINIVWNLNIWEGLFSSVKFAQTGIRQCCIRERRLLSLAHVKSHSLSLAFASESITEPHVAQNRHSTLNWLSHQQLTCYTYSNDWWGADKQLSKLMFNTFRQRSFSVSFHSASMQLVSLHTSVNLC